MVKLSIINDAPKPHKGRIKTWTQILVEGEEPPIICGLYVDHPDFKGKWGHTAGVVFISEPNQFGYRELETKDCRYTLVGKELTWDEYIKARQLLEGNSGAQAYKLLSPAVERPSTVPTSSPKERTKRKDVNKAYYSERTKVSLDHGRRPKGRGLPQST